MTAVGLKRVYEPRARGDGYRVLVDRVWPRGISKEKAAVDQWAKELAPSTGLRKWFGHDPTRWREFRSRYRLELKASADALADLRARCKRQRVTLVYSAKDERHNQAVVLRELLVE
jgi:uncharacterized protein YeaO (DUF488 family)